MLINKSSNGVVSKIFNLTKTPQSCSLRRRISAEEAIERKHTSMERGCLTFAAASSTPPAAAFLRRHAPSFRQSQDKCQHLFRISATNYSGMSRNTDNIRGNMSAKAFKQSLSSEWEVSNYAAPSWLPRFEELDTTNMLLRQRIIFLGTQVCSVPFFIVMNYKF